MSTILQSAKRQMKRKRPQESVIDPFRPGSIVWVDLGSSYGHWPGTIRDEAQIPTLKDENVNSSNIEMHETEFESQQGRKVDTFKRAKWFVKFFDDDPFETYPVPNPSQLKPYICPEKLDLIRQGIDKFSIEKPNCLLDNATRRDQFIKDVELAEVLSMDCDPKVAQLLGELVFLDEPSQTSESSSIQVNSKGKRGKKRPRAKKK